MAEPLQAGTAGDPALLEQIQREAGVHTTIEPSVAEYLEHLWNRLWDWLDALTKGAGGGPVEEWLLWAVLILVPAALAVAVVVAMRKRRRPSPIRRGRRSSTAVAEPVAAAASSHLEELLANGQTRAALGALWARLGRQLDAAGRGRWSADLTEREFIGTVASADPGWEGLGELRAVGRAVVAGVYGPDEPELAQVRALLPRADALAGRAAERRRGGEER